MFADSEPLNMSAIIDKTSDSKNMPLSIPDY